MSPLLRNVPALERDDGWTRNTRQERSQDGYKPAPRTSSISHDITRYDGIALLVPL